MRKAFHQVWGIPVKELLRKGTLNPAIDHVDPDYISSACRDSIDDLTMELTRHDRAVFDQAVDVLHEIVQHEADMVAKYQHDEGIKGKSTHTNLTCFDILADDFDKIFCSAFNWIDPSANPSGFVFDADFLIDKGAAVRGDDLLETYKESLKKVLTENLEPGEYFEAFADVIRRVLLNHQYERSLAKHFLDGVEDKEKARVKAGGKGNIEVVYPGPVPLEWAKEVWHNGKRIK